MVIYIQSIHHDTWYTYILENGYQDQDNENIYYLTSLTHVSSCVCMCVCVCVCGWKYLVFTHSNFQVYSIWNILTVVSMLYIRLSEFTLLITENLYLLTYTSPTTSLCQSLFYFMKSSFLSFFFFFLVPHISESIQYLCLSVCLTSLSICPPGLSVLSQMTVFPFFDWLYNIP